MREAFVRETSIDRWSWIEAGARLDDHGAVRGTVSRRARRYQVMLKKLLRTRGPRTSQRTTSQVASSLPMFLLALPAGHSPTSSTSDAS